MEVLTNENLRKYGAVHVVFFSLKQRNLKYLIICQYKVQGSGYLNSLLTTLPNLKERKFSCIKYGMLG